MIGRCVLLFLAGTALQFIGGDVDASFLTYPWTIVVAINYLYLHILMYSFAHKWKWIKGLYDRPAYLTSLASMLVLTLFFGLIPQDGSTEGFWGMLGFTRMVSSWIFVLFLIHFTTVIGLKAIEDVHHWKQRKLPAVVMHVSFFVLLASAILGSGEKIRVRVMAHQGHPVSVGITGNGKMTELPFTLLLKEFSLEGDSLRFHYLSKVTITDEDGTKEADILVNHPARIGHWWIYQSGYNNAYGSQTVISILECVKDAWYPIIHVAMWLILAGGVSMLFRGWSQRNKRKEGKV